jgi:hypothetical protein
VEAAGARTGVEEVAEIGGWVLVMR